MTLCSVDRIGRHLIAYAQTHMIIALRLELLFSNQMGFVWIIFCPKLNVFSSILPLTGITSSGMKRTTLSVELVQLFRLMNFLLTPWIIYYLLLCAVCSLCNHYRYSAQTVPHVWVRLHVLSTGLNVASTPFTLNGTECINSSITIQYSSCHVCKIYICFSIAISHFEKYICRWLNELIPINGIYLRRIAL